jgi:hypothetical protein
LRGLNEGGGAWSRTAALDGNAQALFMENDSFMAAGVERLRTTRGHENYLARRVVVSIYRKSSIVFFSENEIIDSFIFLFFEKQNHR